MPNNKHRKQPAQENGQMAPIAIHVVGTGNDNIVPTYLPGQELVQLLRPNQSRSCWWTHWSRKRRFFFNKLAGTFFVLRQLRTNTLQTAKAFVENIAAPRTTYHVPRHDSSLASATLCAWHGMACQSGYELVAFSRLDDVDSDGAEATSEQGVGQPYFSGPINDTSVPPYAFCCCVVWSMWCSGMAFLCGALVNLLHVHVHVRC